MTSSDSSPPASAPRPAASWRDSTLGPFQHRIFAAIWLASLVSNFGSVIQSVGASWLMTSIAPSPHMVALVQAATTAPIMLLSVMGGALADIFDRRKIMLAAQIFMAVVSLLLAVLAALHLVSPWALLVMTFLIGAGTALYGPAWQSSVSEQVPRNDLSQAVSLNSLGFNIARSIAPGIGGALIAFGGTQAAFGFNAASYVALIIVLARWKRAPAKSALPPEPLGRAIHAGLRYAMLSPAIIAVLARALLFGFCGGALWALMPLVAHDILHGGPLVFGALFGFFGAGAMAGALLSARLRARMKSDGIVNFGSVAFGLMTAAAGLSPWLFLSLPAMALAGAAWVLTLSTFNVSVQMSSPRWVAGRTISFYQVAAFGGLALGSAFWGNFATGFGLSQTLCVAGLMMLMTLFAGLRFKMPAIEAVDLAPWNRPVLQEPVLSINPRNGPIAMTIEYRVDPDRAAEFVLAMQEMGRIRQRDGARGWRLSQDIDDPEIWAEHYSSPTWMDHLRRQTRPTVADEAARARVLSFHKGGGGPAIRRRLERPVSEPLTESGAARHDAVHDSSLEH